MGHSEKKVSSSNFWTWILLEYKEFCTLYRIILYYFQMQNMLYGPNQTKTRNRQVRSTRRASVQAYLLTSVVSPQQIDLRLIGSGTSSSATEDQSNSVYANVNFIPSLHPPAPVPHRSSQQDVNLLRKCQHSNAYNITPCSICCVEYTHSSSLRNPFMLKMRLPTQQLLSNPETQLFNVTFTIIKPHKTPGRFSVISIALQSWPVVCSL